MITDTVCVTWVWFSGVAWRGVVYMDVCTGDFFRLVRPRWNDKIYSGKKKEIVATLNYHHHSNNYNWSVSRRWFLHLIFDYGHYLTLRVVVSIWYRVGSPVSQPTPHPIPTSPF